MKVWPPINMMTMITAPMMVSPTEHEGEHAHDARGKAQGEGSWVGKNIAQATGDVIKENRPDTKVRPWGGPGLFA